MMRKKFWWTVLVGFAVVLIASMVYLFRTESFPGPQGGTVTVWYRWGFPRILTGDIPQDGRVNYRAIVEDPWGPYSSHGSTTLEEWEDTTSDGQFDLHAVYSLNELRFLELDTNGDGKYDRVLEAEEARSFYVRRHMEVGKGSQPQQD